MSLFIDIFRATAYLNLLSSLTQYALMNMLWIEECCLKHITAIYIMHVISGQMFLPLKGIY